MWDERKPWTGDYRTISRVGAPNGPRNTHPCTLMHVWIMHTHSTRTSTSCCTCSSTGWTESVEGAVSKSSCRRCSAPFSRNSCVMHATPALFAMSWVITHMRARRRRRRRKKAETVGGEACNVGNARKKDTMRVNARKRPAFGVNNLATGRITAHRKMRDIKTHKVLVYLSVR